MKARSLGAAAVLLVGCAALAQAGPVKFQDVPADAKWLVHVDVDAARSSSVMQKAYDECVAGGKLAKAFDKMAKQCGMDPRPMIVSRPCWPKARSSPKRGARSTGPSADCGLGTRWFSPDSFDG